MNILTLWYNEEKRAFALRWLCHQTRHLLEYRSEIWINSSTYKLDYFERIQQIYLTWALGTKKWTKRIDVNIACNVLSLPLRRKVWKLKLYKKMISPNTGLWEDLTNNYCKFPEWAIIGDKMGYLLKKWSIRVQNIKSYL